MAASSRFGDGDDALALDGFVPNAGPSGATTVPLRTIRSITAESLAHPRTRDKRSLGAYLAPCRRPAVRRIHTGTSALPEMRWLSNNVTLIG